MPEQAKVTSIEALESFRTSLIIYLEKARRCVDEISHDVVRTRLWVQNERRLFWETEVRRRTKELEQRQQELFSVQVSVLRGSAIAQQMAVHKAKHTLQEAEARLGLVKQWNRQYDSRVEPLAKEADKVRQVLMHDMRNAVAWLAQAANTLDAYADIAPRGASADGKPPTAPGPAADGNAASEEKEQP